MDYKNLPQQLVSWAYKAAVKKQKSKSKPDKRGKKKPKFKNVQVTIDDYNRLYGKN